MALFRNFHERNLMMKGYILYATIDIERKIDEFLSNYFCENQIKKDEIKELIFYNERISFDFKKELLIYIVKKYYQEFLFKNKDFISNLEKVSPHRNRFAHLEVIEGAELISVIENPKIILRPDLQESLANVDEKTIIFKRHKNGKVQFIGYNRNEMSRIEKVMNSVSEKMTNLNQQPPLAVNPSAPD